MRAGCFRDADRLEESPAFRNHQMVFANRVERVAAGFNDRHRVWKRDAAHVGSPLAVEVLFRVLFIPLIAWVRTCLPVEFKSLGTDDKGLADQLACLMVRQGADSSADQGLDLPLSINVGVRVLCM